MGILLVVVLVLGAVLSWPLPKHLFSGIAASAQNPERTPPRAMIPGDHLQFLYHMWLAQDTFTGNTPWFHNLYEFNTGEDSTRRALMPYYLPFSLFFTVGSCLAGQAFGWNFAILVCLWLTGWFAWKLARRFTEDDVLAMLLAMVPLAFPYTWMNLLGGSPTGFAMMWVPILLYGADRWVGDRSAWGAFGVGAAVFFSEWSDTHVFFFSVLVLPPWMLFVYFYRYRFQWPSRSVWKGWLASAWPLVLFAAWVGVKAWSVQRGLQDTAIAAGRSAHEVGLFAPALDGLWKGQGDAKIYVGVYGLLLLAGLLFGGILQVFRRPKSAAGWGVLALALGIGGIFLLATGPRNPLGPRIWNAVTTLIPPYRMIRQPDKVFCLLPSLWMVALAVLFSQGSARKACGVCLGLLLPLFLVWQARIQPTICLLDRQQGAYAAVAEDAAKRGDVARAIALPLWPGDSHYSSLYQYNSSLYRIRMVNGYRPTARRAYVQDIFEPLESMNLGWPSDAQLDRLLERGIDHVLLHEDAFPEKVSSFPVGATLANLMRHPRLHLLAQDGAVWSFRILETPGTPRANGPMPILFPVRTWNWAQSDWPGEWSREGDASTIGRRYVQAGPMVASTGSRWIRTAGPEPMEWHARVRGTGTVEWLSRTDDGRVEALRHSVNAADWIWLRIPAALHPETVERTVDVQVEDGTVDLDAVLLTREGWRPPLQRGEWVCLPAVCFFRAGYTLPDFSAIRFRKRYDPMGEIFYSRHLYLEPGAYRIILDAETEALEGTLVGHLVFSTGSRDQVEFRAPFHVGREPELRVEISQTVYFRFAFDYARQTDLTLRAVTLIRE
jgi:hypothetical protein